MGEGMGSSATEIRLGTQGFSYRDWVGPFYPPGTPSRDYLARYAQVFDTVELDTTFYAMPPPATVRHWATATPPGFVFAAKLPQGITHEKGLVGAEAELDAFLRAMAPLGEKLGPLLIQLPPSYSAERLEDVRRFLGLLPQDFRFAVEFRHRSWLEDAVFGLLREHNVALAALDLYYMPKRVHVTADWAYIRWLGRRVDVQKFDKAILDRQADLERWATAVREMSVPVVYGYFNNHYAGHSPSSANQFKRLLSLEVAEPAQAGVPTLFDP